MRKMDKVIIAAVATGILAICFVLYVIKKSDDNSNIIERPVKNIATGKIFDMKIHRLYKVGDTVRYETKAKMVDEWFHHKAIVLE